MSSSAPASSTPRETWREFKELVSFLDKPGSALATVLVVVLLLTAHAVASAALQRMMVDALLSRDRPVILTAGSGMVSLEVFYILLSSWWLARRISYSGELGANLRRALAERVFALGTEQVERIDRGKFGSWSTSDVENASEVLNPVYFLALEATQAIAATAYMIVLDWRLGLLCCLSSPLIVHIGNRLSSPMSRLGEKIQATYAEISSLATDAIANRKVIRVFGLAYEVGRRFRSTNDRAYAASRDLVVKSAFLEGAMWFCGIAPLAVPFVYGSLLVFRGTATLGTVMAIIFLSNYTRAPLSEIGKDLGDLRMRVGAAREVLRFLREPSEETPSGWCVKGEVDDTGSIKFDRLSFKYHGSEHMSLDSVSLSVPSGSCTVIVGESGSGKTTLLKVLAGLYPGGALLFVMVLVGNNVGIAIVLRLMVDAVDKFSRDLLVRFWLLYGALALVVPPLMALSVLCMGVGIQRVLRDLRTTLFAKSMALSRTYYDKRGSSFVVSALVNDINLLGQTLAQNIPTFFSSVAGIVAALGIMTSWSPVIVVPITVFTLAVSILNHRYARSMKDVVSSQQQAISEVMGETSSVVLGHTVVRTLRAEKPWFARFAEVTSKALSAVRRRGKIRARIAATRWSSGLFHRLLELISALFVLRGWVTPGMAEATAQMGSQVVSPITQRDGCRTEKRMGHAGR